jgi:cytochrome c-type biogenesis protein
MFNDFLNGSNVNVFVALIAGIVTFFASCLMPLVPTYIAYLSGVSLTNTKEYKKNRFFVFKTAIFFVLGFVLTFVFLSLFVSKITNVFPLFRTVVEKISGVVFLLFGLFMLGVFKHRIFSQERKFDLNTLISKIFKKEKFKVAELFTKHRNLHAVLTGIAFGFGWTPCIGPVLAVILFWATRGSVLQGVSLLLAYGIGLGIPFLLVALAFENVVPLLKKYSRVSQYVSIISGIVILFTGIFLLFGQLESLSLFLLRIIGLSGITA